MINICFCNLDKETITCLKKELPLDWISFTKVDKELPDIIISDGFIFSETIPHLCVLPYNFDSIQLYNRDNVFYSVFSITNRDSLIKRGIDIKNIFITGYPRYDNLKKIQELRKDESLMKSINKKLGNIHGYPVVSYFCTKGTERITRDLIIIKELVTKCFKNDFFLHIVDGKNSYYKSDLGIQNLIDSNKAFITYERSKKLTNQEILLTSSLILSEDNNMISVEAVVSNTPAVIISAEKSETSLMGVLYYPDCTFLDNAIIKFKYNLSENQMNYVLSNYFPFSFDGENSKRTITAISFILQYLNLIETAKTEYYNKLSKSCIKLIDPLSEIREKFSNRLEI